MTNEQELRKQQILDLTSEIAKAADDGVGANSRDIVAAAKTILKIAQPSAVSDQVKLTIRLAPHIPSEDRVELPDGSLLGGVRAIELCDQNGEARVAKITVVGPTVLGDPATRRT
jgi:hypothetical protein